ncbi:MAG: hypothetical protein ABIG20_02080 [archaeon]
MALFKKKDKNDEIPILKEQRELQELVKKYREKEREKSLVDNEFTLESNEYQQFVGERAEGKKSHTYFEKLCSFSGKHLKVGMKKKDEDKMNEHLYFIGYNIEARDVISFSILTFLISVFIAGALLLFSFPAALIIIMIGLSGLFGIQQYPKYLSKLYIMDTLNEMPLAITYMVIYMRSAPTLEGAVRFTARHLSGSLGRDLEKMLWDLETNIYTNMDDALANYAAKWRDANKNFSNSIEVLRNSEKIGNEGERLKMLDEATNIILSGNLETMESFGRSLKMPIIVLYMMCIVLPVMGLVIAPVMTTLVSQGVSVNAIALVYNIILPLFVYFFIKFIMSKRPGSFMNPDISTHPGLPKPGHMRVGSHDLPLLPLSIIIFFVVSLPTFLMFANPPENVGYSLANILKSLAIVWGAALAIGLYGWGSSFQKLSVRKNLIELERDLDIAIYTMADKLKMGIPIERAVADTSESMKTGAMKEFLDKIGTNMKNFGMPFETAIFDPKNGALINYPSKLVRTIMEVLVESAQKGIKATATSMATIGTYLKNLKKVNLTIEELLSETANTMKFQAQFMTSFIAGIIISLDVLLFKILTELGGKINSLDVSADVTGSVGVSGIFQNSMFNVASAIPAEQMQIVVGIYMIQVTFLLSLLINGVQNGRDNIYRNYMVGKNLMIATLVYTIAMLAGVFLFSAFKLGV